MIDDITEGRPYETQVKTNEETSQLMISCDADGFGFEMLTPVGPIGALVDDPRTAREIAAALVAWANRKDGTINLAAMSILGSIRWAELKNTTVAQIAESPAPEDCNFPKVWHTSATHRRFHYADGKCLPVERKA